MPKRTLNDFIDKHSQRVCVVLQFSDYKRLKDAARKAKRPLQTIDGKLIPSPMAVITKTIASYAKADFALQSIMETMQTGVVIRALFADRQEALALAKIFLPLANAESFKPGDNAPCTAHITAYVDGEIQTALAKKFGLL